MKSTDISRIVREEVDRMIKESKDAAPETEKELEKLRVKFMPDMLAKDNQDYGSSPALEKRVQLKTVSELLDIPVNELMLYFLNNVKTKNTRSLVEYRLGFVYFYAI